MLLSNMKLGSSVRINLCDIERLLRGIIDDSVSGFLNLFRILNIEVDCDYVGHVGWEQEYMHDGNPNATSPSQLEWSYHRSMDLVIQAM